MPSLGRFLVLFAGMWRSSEACKHGCSCKELCSATCNALGEVFCVPCLCCYCCCQLLRGPSSSAGAIAGGGASIPSAEAAARATAEAIAARAIAAGTYDSGPPCAATPYAGVSCASIPSAGAIAAEASAASCCSYLCMGKCCCCLCCSYLCCCHFLYQLHGQPDSLDTCCTGLETGQVNWQVPYLGEPCPVDCANYLNGLARKPWEQNYLNRTVTAAPTQQNMPMPGPAGSQAFLSAPRNRN